MKNETADLIDSVPSPCVRNCCLDDQDVCMGCHRLLSEILAWHQANDAEKREILAKCRLRKLRGSPNAEETVKFS